MKSAVNANSAGATDVGVAGAFMKILWKKGEKV
jgi:hypothetical protein